MGNETEKIYKQICEIVPTGFKHIILIGSPDHIDNLGMSNLRELLFDKYGEVLIIYYYSVKTEIQMLKPIDISKEDLDIWYNKIVKLITA